MAGKPGEADQGITLILLAGVMLGVGYVIWYFFHEQIIEIIRFVRLMELHVIGWFTDAVTMPDGSRTSVQSLIQWLASTKADHLSWDQMAIMSATIVPQFLRIPAALFLFLLAGLAYKTAPRTKLRHVLKLEDLINVQTIAWPVIAPIAKLNPATGPQRAPGEAIPARLPPFAEALSPEEFVAFHHIPVQNKVIDSDAAARVFTRQLGPRWQGWDKLPMHYQAIAAALALKGARQRDAADALLGEIGQAWTPAGGLKLPLKLTMKIKSLLRDPKVGGEAAKVMAAHSFVVPGMYRLLLWARERGGVLAAATFIWLRAVDRGLWYPLNNAGRRTFHPEAAGAVAHYYAEKFLRRPLINPKVQAAVDALAAYMKESEMQIPQAMGKPAAPKSSLQPPRRGSFNNLTVAQGRT